ncbi:MAG: hypothetical protein ACFUZC_12290 [Chthoniobacteraceae bacterium]
MNSNRAPQAGDNRLTSERKALFSVGNQTLWRISVDESGLGNWIRPYIGSGLLGIRFGGLIVASWNEPPLKMYSKFIFDDARQLELPTWLHLDIRVGGLLYTPEQGRHSLTNTLDLLRGVVELEDDWEYLPGKTLHLSMRLALLRHRSHCGLLTLRIQGLGEPCRVEFGINGGHLGDLFDFRFEHGKRPCLLGHYTTRVQKREVTQGLCWKGTGAHLEGEMIEGGMAKLTLVSSSDILDITLGHSIHSEAQGPDCAERVQRDLADLLRAAPGDLFEQSASVWRELWKQGLAYEGADAKTTQMVIAHQFYLLGSVGEDALPLGALGLSKNEWHGTQLWDADFWIFRALLPLWPKLAEPILRYRFLCLEPALLHAAAHGWRGAWFPWMSAEDGADQTKPEYQKEIHLGVWIALSAWEYFQFTKDPHYLRKMAWPLIANIARFYCSRVTAEGGGRYRLKDVIGPDEALTEHWQGACDDHFTTVWGIKQVMRAALASAEILRQSPDEDWSKVEAGLRLPPADGEGIFPEYTGYAGDGIKQADLILSFYPLDYRAPEEVILKNVEYYSRKIMGYGPAMNSQIESCIFMRLGRKKEGIEHLFRTFREFVRGPHFIPFECRNNDNSFMLTGIAGTLQALIYGYYGATVAESSCVPKIGDCWEA